MGRTRKTQRTLVGTIAAEVLAYTSGRDLELDAQLVEVDCIGTAAHVTMLARLPQAVRPFGAPQRHKIVAALLDIMRDFRAGKLRLRAADQDVHLAVERILTRQLGDLGRKIHLGRSRNDQAAVDLRLYSKEQLLQIMQAALELAEALLKLARSQAKLPMVGRTHMQPAMPSSVGLWASAYAESLLEDVLLLQSVYRLNDQCPLGSAAGYGVPLPIDRHYVAQALGFSRPLRNVFHAGNTRGKIEATILASLSQAMISISRLAQDLMLFTLPEFNYMALPAELGTGSSIMPQKNNPDVLELVRARAARVISWTGLAMQLVRGLPGGYNRDLQEAKEPLLDGLQQTQASLRIMRLVVGGLRINRQALLDGFRPEVFATDVVLDKVSQGMPFRAAYQYVKEHLAELPAQDPARAIARKKHLGGTADLDFRPLANQIRVQQRFVQQTTRDYHQALSRLLGQPYPLRERG